MRIDIQLMNQSMGYLTVIFHHGEIRLVSIYIYIHMYNQWWCWSWWYQTRLENPAQLGGFNGKIIKLKGGFSSDILLPLGMVPIIEWPCGSLLEIVFCCSFLRSYSTSLRLLNRGDVGSTCQRFAPLLHHFCKTFARLLQAYWRVSGPCMAHNDTQFYPLVPFLDHSMAKNGQVWADDLHSWFTTRCHIRYGRYLYA